MYADIAKRYAAAQRWRQKNKNHVKATARAWRHNNRAEYNKRSALYRATHRTQILTKRRENHRRKREMVIRHYTNGKMACQCCGENEYLFLCADHIGANRDKKERRGGSTNLYRRLVSAGFPPGIQILCWNCNCGKRGGPLCPHHAIPTPRTRGQLSWERIRKLIIGHYSGNSSACSCCGEAKFEFLTLDHPNNDGKKDCAGLVRSQLYHRLRREGYPSGYRVLCWNCNCGRAFNDGICPHTNRA